MAEGRPLSQVQQAQWFLYRLAPTACVYNTGIAVRVHSGLDLSALRTAVAAVADRHDLLRSTFAEHNGRPARTVHLRPLVELAVREVPDDGLAEQVRAELAAPFRLESTGAFRVSVLRPPAGAAVLLVAGAHIATDAVSNALLLRDLLRAHHQVRDTGAAHLPPPPVSYDERIAEEQRFLAQPQAEELAGRLRTAIAGATVGRLPIDRPRPDRPALTGATHHLTLPADRSGALRARARDLSVTPFVLLATVLQAALLRYNRRGDFLIGAPVTTRLTRASREAIGNYVNTVVLRAQLNPRLTFREAVRRTDARLREQLGGVRYPFPLLANSFHTTLYRVGLNLLTPGQVGAELAAIVDTTGADPVHCHGVTLTPFRVPQQEGQLDLMVDVLAGAHGLAIDLRYDSALFHASSIDRFATGYLGLLDHALTIPDAPIGRPAPERERVDV